MFSMPVMLIALVIPRCTIYLNNLGPALCRVWWWFERVETCSPEVVIVQ